MFLFASLAQAQKFAVIYAGSNTFSNYRHQTDCMTIYGMLLKRGYSKSNIIHFHYDDLAQNTRNPYKGQLFHTTAHVNIYDSTYINFKGNTITAKQFYDTLTTLPTTSNDNIFVYYDNHGGPDILGVPDGCGSYITGEGLNDAFNAMAKAGLYKYILFGIEACYAGSVAEKFTAPNMATITASNNHESSYAYAYDSGVGTYLSNEFTWMWIIEMDQRPTEYIGDLYDNVKRATAQSHVTWYGDEKLKSLPISDFFGVPNMIEKSAPVNPNDSISQISATRIYFEAGLRSSNPRIRAHTRLEKSIYEAQHQRLEIALEEIAKYAAPNRYSEMLSKVDGIQTHNYLECLDYFVEKFGQINGDDLPMLVAIRNLAANYSTKEVKEAIDTVL